MKKQKVYDFLNELGIEYKNLDHEPLMSIYDAEELDRKLGVNIAKNLFLSTKHSTEFYLLLMKGDKKFNTGKVSKQVQVPRMTFGSDEKLLELLDLTPGSVSPLGLINDTENNVNFLIDKDLLNDEFIAVHPNMNTSTVVIRLSDLLEKVLPKTNHTYRVVEV